MYCWSLAWRISRITFLSEAPEKPSDGCSSSVHLTAAPWGTLSQVTQPSCSRITDPQKFCRIWSIQESPQRCESAVACCWVRGTECNIVSTNPFEGGLHYLHYPHYSLALGQTTEGEHSLTHKQKIVLKIYWVWPHPSEQDPVSLTVNLFHQEASISLLSLSIRGQTEGKPQSEN